MNSKKSRANESKTLQLHLYNNLDLKRQYERILDSSLSMYYTLENIKKEYRNNKVEIFWGYIEFE